MNYFEEARALWGTMRMCGLSQADAAKRLGVSQSFVANKLRLLRFSAPMQDRMIEGGLTERHARTVLRLEREEDIAYAVGRICEEKMNVAQTEAFIDSLTAGGESTSVILRFSAEIEAAIASLAGERVSIRKSTEPIDGGGWRTTIELRQK